MLSSKTLLSPEEAAGFAMAAPQDDDFEITTAAPPATLDEALRHGHSAAARKTQPAALTETIQNAVAHWWNGNGKAHA
jgi:hypothetical protein